MHSSPHYFSNCDTDEIKFVNQMFEDLFSVSVFLKVVIHP